MRLWHLQLIKTFADWNVIFTFMFEYVLLNQCKFVFQFFILVSKNLSWMLIKALFTITVLFGIQRYTKILYIKIVYLYFSCVKTNIFFSKLIAFWIILPTILTTGLKLLCLINQMSTYISQLRLHLGMDDQSFTWEYFHYWWSLYVLIMQHIYSVQGFQILLDINYYRQVYS